MMVLQNNKDNRKHCNTRLHVSFVVLWYIIVPHNVIFWTLNICSLHEPNRIWCWNKWKYILCTMMKPHFKGKTTSTKPMYSRKLIHPRVYDNTPQLHRKAYSACGRENTPQCLICGIIVQVSCTVQPRLSGPFCPRADRCHIYRCHSGFVPARGFVPAELVR